MPKAWKHPKLGEFAASDSGWSTTAKIPAFKKFSYDTGYSNARRSTGNVHVGLSRFLAYAKVPNTPPDEMVALLDHVIVDPQALVDKVVAALWDDFNGRGPDSGVWWHGNMKAINDSFKSHRLPPPKTADDLLQALQVNLVMIFDEWWDHPAPVIYLSFHALFEEEHGVAIL